jgi:secondary thiamine-phosphate synthase enzyme
MHERARCFAWRNNGGLGCRAARIFAPSVAIYRCLTSLAMFNASHRQARIQAFTVPGRRFSSGNGLPSPRQKEYNESMKSLTEHLWFEVPGRRGFVNITQTVEDLVRKSGVKEGLCLVNAMHITASVFINDDESGLLHDYDEWLEKLAPHAPTAQYHHNRTGEDNADAHLKRQIMGREVVVAITNGRLDFGPWEQIFYGEFDGRRRKRALVKIIGE